MRGQRFVRRRQFERQHTLRRNHFTHQVSDNRQSATPNILTKMGFLESNVSQSRMLGPWARRFRRSQTLDNLEASETKAAMRSTALSARWSASRAAAIRLQGARSGARIGDRYRPARNQHRPGRACPGHPRGSIKHPANQLKLLGTAWMPGTSPGKTAVKGGRKDSRAPCICLSEKPMLCYGDLGGRNGCDGAATALARR